MKKIISTSICGLSLLYFTVSLMGESEPRMPDIQILHAQTVTGLGAGQGVMIHEGKVYLYGDALTGVIREYDFILEDARPRLEYTGLEIKLTQHGIDVCPHPTGLTTHPKFGTYLGNTVAGKGTIFHVDWQKMKKDRNLNRAILNVTEDDAAVNGCRPEFMMLQGKRKKEWFVATADYGELNNQIRFYNPGALSSAKRTTDKGVLVVRYRSDPWVQTLHWVQAPPASEAQAGYLYLVQNQIEGLLYRLTPMAFKYDGSLHAMKLKVIDFQKPRDELEGFGFINSNWAIFYSSSSKQNVWFAQVHNCD